MLGSRLRRVTSALGRRQSSLARLTPAGGVHGSQSMTEPRQWRNKALLRVHGEELFFKTGTQAVNLLVNESKRRDGNKGVYLDQFGCFMQSLAPVFDRSPRYAWIAKILLEPERFISFRVSYIDDSGNTRTNRGFRASTSARASADLVKSMAFDGNFGNALTGARLGGAAGGSNFEPRLASESEIQRFCQSFMTELSKYVGPDRDLPSMGVNVGAAEPDGIAATKFEQISTIKAERGARVGRYIIASTTAKFNEPEDIYSIPCDIVFPTIRGEIDADVAARLADNGCAAVVDAGYAPSTPSAIRAYKKLGMAYGPFKASLAAGTAIASTSSERVIYKEAVIDAVDEEAKRIFEEAKRTANEYNVRGDLHQGTNIASFLRVANVMAAHGAI
ncbi:glutamate dehydrogenase [Aureococcus anophagefferens]|nr:glutamate dehydrogenase [Aureococcus anophagefferens]